MVSSWISLVMKHASRTKLKISWARPLMKNEASGLFHTVDGWNPANHLGCMKPYKEWVKLPINWCRISAINSMSCIWGYRTILERLSTLYRSSLQRLGYGNQICEKKHHFFRLCPPTKVVSSPNYRYPTKYQYEIWSEEELITLVLSPCHHVLSSIILQGFWSNLTFINLVWMTNPHYTSRIPKMRTERMFFIMAFPTPRQFSKNSRE